jgi:hypothetical protein
MKFKEFWSHLNEDIKPDGKNIILKVYKWHLDHSCYAVALTFFIGCILKIFIPITLAFLISAFLSCEVVFFIFKCKQGGKFTFIWNKPIVERKDTFTDWNEYQIGWLVPLLFLEYYWYVLLCLCVILCIYKKTIKWAIP